MTLINYILITRVINYRKDAGSSGSMVEHLSSEQKVVGSSPILVYVFKQGDKTHIKDGAYLDHQYYTYREEYFMMKSSQQQVVSSF